MTGQTSRDGFIVKRIDNGEEIDFIACDKSDSMRERSMMGLLRNMRDDLYVADTRDLDGGGE